MNYITFVRCLFALLLMPFATAATVSIAQTNQQVAYEGTPNTAAVILLQRGAGDSVAASQAVTFVVSGTATRGVDYELSSLPAQSFTTTLTIPEGQQSIQLIITPITDAAREGEETVGIQIVSVAGTGNVPGVPNSASIPIADDDLVVSLLTPLPTAFEDYTPGPGTVLDPDVNRRGVFHVTVTSPAVVTSATPSNYIITELSSGGAFGAATLGTDYTVTYKIGGKDMGQGRGYLVQPRHYLVGGTQVAVTGGSGVIPLGSSITFSGHSATTYTTTALFSATTGTLSFTPGLAEVVANDETVTVTSVNSPTSFKINQATTPPISGDVSVTVTGGTGPIPPGATISFAGLTGNYTTAAGLNSPSGLLTLTAPLSGGVAHNANVTVSGPIRTGLTTAGATSEPIGGQTLILTGGTGGFARGDVFRIGAQTSPQYVVTGWTQNTTDEDGELAFESFTGGTSPGLDSVLTGNPEIVTHFPASFSGPGGRQIQVLVPATSTQVDYGITPVSDATPEASETLLMQLVTSNNFQTAPPTIGQIDITDDDVVVAFDPSLSLNATEGGTNGSFRVTLSSAFPDQVDIAYLISGTATADVVVNGVTTTLNDYAPLSGTLSIPANSTYGIITVPARDDGLLETTADTLILTLQPTNDYRVVTSVGANANASAQITLNDKLGTVSLETVSGQIAGREHPTAVTTARFVVTLRDDAGAVRAAPTDLTVNYSVGGSATNGTDYLTLTGSAIITSGASSQTITVTPVDDSAPESTETVALTLSPAQGYLISTTANLASITIADDEPAVGIVKSSDATEGGAAGVFTVGYLPPALNRDITVDVTYAGTAGVGDFTATASQGLVTAVVIKANENSATVTIAPTDDSTPEGSETVIATITPKPAVYTLSPLATATMSLIDDEPVLKIVKLSDTEEGSATKGSFRVFYEGASVGRDIAVTLSYPAATATAADFITAPPTTVTIPSTGSEIVVEISAKYDGIAEGSETVECTIVANAAVYTIATASATLTITDRIPTLTLTCTTSSLEGNSANAGTFDITSSFAPLTPITIAYTVTGTAIPGAAAGGTVDYKTLSGTVSLSGTTASIPVEAFTDALFDPEDTIIVTLTEVTPPTFAKAGTTALSATMQIIDAIPGVVYLTSDVADGTTLGKDDVALITVYFSQPMTVSGNPTLTIETGLNDTLATFVRSENNGYQLVFRYVVRSTDTSPDMDYAGTTALALNGGTILGIGGVAATLTLPAPGSADSLSAGGTRPIDGEAGGGKPAPGIVPSDGGGGCGLGSGLAALVALALCMLAGLALSAGRPRA